MFGFQLDCGSRRGAWHNVSISLLPAELAVMVSPSGRRFQEQ